MAEDLSQVQNHKAAQVHKVYTGIHIKLALLELLEQ